MLTRVKLPQYLRRKWNYSLEMDLICASGNPDIITNDALEKLTL
jgi:hypothetical protein